MLTVMEKDEALEVVSTNVTRLLGDRGWSLSELARRSKNTVMLISRLTRKENMPAGDVLQRIAEAFDVKIDYLFTPTSGKSKIPA
jgi:transcriptional regulator with XRE-family HTH domain